MDEWCLDLVLFRAYFCFSAQESCLMVLKEQHEVLGSEQGLAVCQASTLTPGFSVSLALEDFKK